MIKSLSDIYDQVRSTLRPAPCNPHYLFSLKDIARVVQGLQLVASKSKPSKEAKASQTKKSEAPEDQSSSQTILLVRLFCHETLRVFTDRITDRQDELWFKALLNKTIVSNFCVSKDLGPMKQSSGEEQTTMSTTFLTASQDYEAELTTLNNGNPGESQRQDKKKAVTFKKGLFLSEREFTAHSGALLNYDSLGFGANYEEAFANLVFSKFIVKGKEG